MRDGIQCKRQKVTHFSTRNETEVRNLKRRLSLIISEEMENQIIELRKTDEYCRKSFSEIIRELIETGLDERKDDKQ